MRPAQLLLLLLLASPLLLLSPAESRVIGHHRTGGHHRAHDHSRHAARPSPSPSSAELAIRDICADTDYPDLCVATALPYAAAARHIHRFAVAAMLIRGAADRTREVIASTGKIAAASPAPVASNLKECLSGFQDSLDAIAETRKAIAAGNSGAALSHLSAAITGYEDCVNTFYDRPAPNPVANEISLLENLVSNCLAVIRVAFGVPSLPGGG